MSNVQKFGYGYECLNNEKRKKKMNNNKKLPTSVSLQRPQIEMEQTKRESLAREA